MTPPPVSPKIYHITHVDNLVRIASTGELWCDRLVAESGAAIQVIGMSAIKARRIEELMVTCHPGTKVGDYVPFYFCPRSVMLYVIHMANHPELAYREGQGPIVHLEADLHRVIAWALANSPPGLLAFERGRTLRAVPTAAGGGPRRPARRHVHHTRRA